MNLVPSQIPANIDTVEKLATWCGLLLHFGFPTQLQKEAENYTDYVAQASAFTSGDGSDRLVLRLNLKLHDNFMTGTQPLWQKVHEFGEMDIPAGFLV